MITAFAYLVVGLIVAFFVGAALFGLLIALSVPLAAVAGLVGLLLGTRGARDTARDNPR